MATARSNAEWIRWGEIDPHWGVASWEGKQAGSDSAWNDEEFYELGRKDWLDLHQRWDRYGVTHDSALEIGCGTGRMTRAMAADFDRVDAVDVAPGMLSKAAAAVQGHPVYLHHVDGLTLPFPDATFDAAFSTFVFQHLDSVADADANWREISRVLKPGGTLMVQLPVHVWPAGLQRLQTVYDAKRKVGDWRAAIQRKRMHKGGQPIMRGMSYEWSALENSLTRLGFVDVELSIIRTTSNGGQHMCVLARRET